MYSPSLNLKPHEEASLDWPTRVLLGITTVGIPSTYFLRGGGIRVFESGDWLFILALPACAMFFALNRVAWNDRRITHVFGVWAGVGFSYGTVKWSDVISAEVGWANRGRSQKLILTTLQGRRVAFSVPSNSSGAIQFRRIADYFSKVSN